MSDAVEIAEDDRLRLPRQGTSPRRGRPQVRFDVDISATVAQQAVAIAKRDGRRLGAVLREATRIGLATMAGTEESGGGTP